MGGLGLEASMKELVEPERSLGESAVIFVLYLALAIISIISNGSVILAAIIERWAEIDSFTFVFCISLSFCQLFISFFIYPVISYAIIARSWDLQRLWCWWCALSSSYLHTVYSLHVVVLLFDMIVVKYSDVRTLIPVSLSKRIVLNTWAVSLIPQVYPLLAIENPYLYDPIQGGCFQTFLFSNTITFCKCFAIYIILPLVVIGVWYITLLFKEENNRRLAATISRRWLSEPSRGIRNYKTSICLGVMAGVTALPWVTCGLVNMGRDIIPRQVLEFSGVWLSFSSILVPIIYLLTCPTYFRSVFPEDKFSGLYKLGLGKQNVIKNGPILKPINIISMIVEEEDDESEGDYIELPAITVNKLNSSSIIDRLHLEEGNKAVSELPEVNQPSHKPSNVSVNSLSPPKVRY